MNAPFQSYLNPSVGQYSGSQSASNPLGWDNYNTYAPWTEPNGATGQNPSFSGYGQGNSIGFGNSGMGSWSHALDPMTGSWFGLGSKRSSPNFYAPSYQGTLFQPDNGYGASYGSPGGSNYSTQPLSAAAQYSGAAAYPGSTAGASSSAPAASNLTGPQYAGGSGLQQSQSYLGQTPYGVAGQSYMPSQGGLSYGGYSNYGGYGNSGAGMQQNQPYFPGQ